VQAATARAHRASMALSGAVGLLVFGFLGLLYVSARRAHALAQDRMAIAAAVSHELRTPVAAILTVAENLRDGVVSAPEQVAAYGAVLAGEAQRLHRTVEHTLALTRPSGGVFERVDLVDVAKTAVARVQAQHPEALLHLDAPGPTFVVADADALEGALVNLIENAVKYGAGRPVDISVRSAQGRVEIRIEDRGIGLAEGEAARVFEPFYRGAEARRVAPGIGLGLPLVRRVAEVHGGRVQAAAREGGGARFTVSLPRSETRGRTREPVFDHKVNPSG
ncbi:MAG TPA: HAMP domain-containing sensor histidine kinase, partial [Rhodothermales bacterium]|nr:HAMP domain-containing sensor histidine kinase [Rhodothermales bacterium]